MTIQTIIGLSFIIIAALLAVSAVSYKIGREQGRADFIKDAFEEALAKGYRPPENGLISMRVGFQAVELRDPEDDIRQTNTKHAMTHADLVQMETAAKNMAKDEPMRKGPFTLDVLSEKLKKSKAWVVDWMTKHKIAAMPNNDGIEASYMEPQYMLTDQEYSQIGEDALK